MKSTLGLTLNTLLISIVIAQDIQFHVDRRFPRRYCGSRLARVLSEFCLSFYSPSSGKYYFLGNRCTHKLVNSYRIRNYYPDNRVKRQITTECCYNECSLDYLLDSYCASVDTERLNRVQNTDVQEIQRSSVPPQIRRLRKNMRRPRNKRNCLCKGNRLRKRRKKTDDTVKPIQEPRLGNRDEGGFAFYVEQTDNGQDNLMM
ncbi:unnamed protein product [Acanthoscelides obtectus]|uniref:Insulin-like domain-containing protein n=1 Tax=Acanthoscelides obtectus TaxID=200917 RepID=A0A9P0KN64_ACAOB|nr:unnamed protein product [Acanthoscelides obtectus]CAK1664779.1 hypothetical protein AOBTE_LOCUS24459 [Acanthoscelides obtectus]